MSQPIQLIDKEGKFKDGLPSALSSWGFTPTGTSYHVLAIMGSQSSGKSTLLNRLFATQFEEMQDRTQQTTTGIWVSPAARGSILIMDVEGVDGSERGQDTAMERKTTLFSLAIAEVVLMNIWANQINNLRGSNMELIGMVMQQVVALFGGGNREVPKTLLFFVVRDARPRQRTETGTADIWRVLRCQLNNIWANTVKEQAVRFDDYFEVKLAVLPIIDFEEEFDGRTRRLSDEFYDKTPETAIFQRRYHRGALIDGLPKYLQDIWSEVDQNEFANLPSIRRLNQGFLCDKYKREALESIKHISFDPYPFNGANTVDQIEGMMRKWGDGVMESFEKAITLCDEDLCQTKRKELSGEIDEYMHHISITFRVQHCNRIMDLALNQLRDDVQTRIASRKSLNTTGVLLQQLKDKALAVYKHGASPNGGNFLFTIGEAYSSIRDELIIQIHDLLYLLFERRLTLHSNSVMKGASKEMSNMSFLDATARSTGEDIRDKAANSFESSVKSWIPEGCNWVTEGSYWRMWSRLEERRKLKRDRIIRDMGRAVAATATSAVGGAGIVLAML